MRKLLILITLLSLNFNTWGAVEFCADKIQAQMAVPNGSYINVNWTGIGASNPRTIACWIQAPDEDTLVPNDLICDWGPTGAGNGERWTFGIEASGDKLLTAVQGGNVQGLSDVSDGVWHHVACVLPEGGDSVGDIILYFDGADDTGLVSVDVDINTVLQFNLHVGSNRFHSSIFYKGKISDFAVWDAELTQPEIDLLYSSRLKGMPYQIQPANLQLYLPHDDIAFGASGIGSTFYDRSGNGRNGTGGQSQSGYGLDGIGEEYLSYPE